MPSTPKGLLKDQISKRNFRTQVTTATLGFFLLITSAFQIKAEPLTEPVQVYILLGQSNMLGYGQVTGGTDGRLDYAVNNKGLYPYLSNGAGGWAAPRDDVRNIRLEVSGAVTPGSTGRVHVNNWLTVAGLSRIGPEIGIGQRLGEAIDAPVMLLKSCNGNRALGWDLLPPGGVQYDYTDGYTYPGFGESPQKWLTGTTPIPITWYAGAQYLGDTRSAKAVLDNIGTYYPGATEYVVAGFFWWQGDRNRGSESHSVRYEQNLVRLIEQLRLEFDAPNANFVCATLGQTVIGSTGNEGHILDAQFAINDAVKYPQFRRDVATVYSHPLSKGGTSDGHYNNNAETYMNVGEAMGQAMVDLTFALPMNFSEWSSGFNLDDSSFSGDEDGDHLPNGIEAFFGTPPGRSNPGFTQISKSRNTVTYTH